MERARGFNTANRTQVGRLRPKSSSRLDAAGTGKHTAPRDGQSAADAGDEQILEPLLSVAIAETEPDEVMRPVKAPGGLVAGAPGSLSRVLPGQLRRAPWTDKHPDVRDRL
jgi:hypothetical protein